MRNALILDFLTPGGKFDTSTAGGAGDKYEVWGRYCEKEAQVAAVCFCILYLYLFLDLYVFVDGGKQDGVKKSA